MRDVWFPTDGMNWTQATSTPGLVLPIIMYALTRGTP